MAAENNKIDDSDDWLLHVGSQERQHGSQFHLSDNELLCKQCGSFYGTPQCRGLCSQCYKTYQYENKRLNDYNKNRELLRQETAELRRKTSDVRNTFKTLLKKSPSVFGQNSPSSSSSPTSLNLLLPNVSNTPTGPRPMSPESNDATLELQKYFDDIFDATFSKELGKHCCGFVENLQKNEFSPIEELSNSVQSFYQTTKEKIIKIKPPEDFKFSQFMTEIETFVCTRAYNILFGSRTEEEAEDLSLQTRIRSLNWVINGFLETALDETSAQVQEYLNEAITEIIDLNSHRSVIKKMDCLVRSSKNIFDALKESRFGAPASADEFLPVLILVVLKANPPLIQSNLKFISRFGLPSRHMRGEYGYYYTNLMSAIYFIQDMKASHLQISEDEFEGYTTGKLVPPSTRALNTYVMRSIGNSLKRLDGLLQAQNEFNAKIGKLEEKIESDCAKFKREVKEFVEQDSEATKEIIERISEQNNQKGDVQN